jgi:two-component system sensor histidine kinase KdpD
VSHDLRTPLAAISASASSLRRFQTELDAETKAQLLEAIEEQCARLDRLTTNLLNIGRIEGGLDVKQMPVIDAVEVLGSALARVRQVHAGHQFEKDFQIKSGAVRADEPLLEQVFVNVLENAAVHTAAGTTVKVSSLPQPGCLLISVEDDGDGIPKADRTRIFERFFQGGSDTRVKSGSGVGLSIAKGFAERIGGSIRACSAERPLRGAKIEIELPLVREQ